MIEGAHVLGKLPSDIVGTAIAARLALRSAHQHIRAGHGQYSYLIEVSDYEWPRLQRMLRFYSARVIRATFQFNRTPFDSKWTLEVKEPRRKWIGSISDRLVELTNYADAIRLYGAPDAHSH